MDVFRDYKFQGAKRSKKRRVKFWMLLSLAAFLALLVIFFIKLVLEWRVFDVSGISVSNPTSVPNAEIINSVRNLMLRSRTKALVGPRNMLFWGIGAKPSSLEDLPAVKSVDISSNLMKRTVSISVVPRTPAGVICEATSTVCFVFDESGIIFSPSPDVEGSLILKVNDFTGRYLMPGENVLSDPDWFQNFMAVVNTLKSKGFAISEIDFNDLSLREWQVSLIDGPVFYFSFGFVPDDFSSILANLSMRMDFKRASYVDFRVPDRIYYK